MACPVLNSSQGKLVPGRLRQGAAAFLLLASSGTAEVLNPNAGARIYTMGQGRDAMSAYLPVSATRTSAANFPCATCHGEDGGGGKEGGVEAPPLTRARAMPLPAVEAWLGKALRARRRIDGKAMGEAMPTYAVSQRDLSALAAYVRQLPYPVLPGVTANGVGIIVQARGSGLATDDIGVLVRLVAEREDEFNRSGAVFGRTLSIIVDTMEGRAEPDHFAAISWRGETDQVALIPVSVEHHISSCGAVYPSADELDRKRHGSRLGNAVHSGDVAVFPFDIDRQRQGSAQVMARGASSIAAASKIVSLLDALEATLSALRRSGRRIAPKALCRLVGEELYARRRGTILRGVDVEFLDWGSEAPLRAP
jgi:mono/diheme cytochrome c family protein